MKNGDRIARAWLKDKQRYRQAVKIELSYLSKIPAWKRYNKKLVRNTEYSKRLYDPKWGPLRYHSIKKFIGEISDTIRNNQKQLDTEASAGELTPKEVKQWQELIDTLRKEQEVLFVKIDIPNNPPGNKQITEEEKEAQIKAMLNRMQNKERERLKDLNNELYKWFETIFDLEHDGKITHKEAEEVREYINGYSRILPRLDNEDLIACRDNIMKVRTMIENAGRTASAVTCG